MPRVKTRVQHPSNWRPFALNLWFSRYNTDHPLLADDAFRECDQESVDWIAIFCELASESNGFRTPVDESDVAARALRWMRVDEIEISEQTEVLYLEALDFMGRFHKDGKPLPNPVPTEPPPPTKPSEPTKPSKPQEPEEPTKPTKPTKPSEWKKVVGYIAGVLAMLGVGIKLFLPAWADVLYDAVVRILEAISK